MGGRQEGLAMDDALQRAREARTLAERLGARIPGFRGYIERELRREVDQLLRGHLAGRLDEARDALAAEIRRLPLAATALLGRLSSCEKQIDTVANRLRHAGSGYHGLFDAVKVREEELEALYRFDLSLTDSVDAVVAEAGRAGEDEAGVAALEEALAVVRTSVAARDQVLDGAFRGAS
jgi:hypothetical protein